MSRKIIAVFLMLALVLLYIPVSSGETQENQGVSKSRYIIGLTGHADEGIISMITGVGGKPKHDFGEMNVISADLPDAAVNGLLHNPRIEYIRPAVLVHATEDILDWGVDKVDAEVVWGGIEDSKDVIPGAVAGNGVKVAIIDTGIDMNHEDLQGNIAGGWNAINESGDFDDDNSHGTHCSGIVAAIDNGIGVIGVAPEVELYGVKALDSGGSGWSDDIAAGIIWAVDNASVDIISMSLGSDYPMSLVGDACDYAETNGVLVLAAAGNDYKNMRRNTVDYPGAYASVIAVAATTSSDARAYFSSTGSQVELAAPGYSIYSTVIGSYGYKSGTSMATPMAVGVAALVMSADPNLTNVEVRSILGDTAVDLGTPGRDIEFGFGRVDALAAVVAVEPIEPIDNEQPIANVQSLTTDEDNQLAVTLTGSDLDDDILTYIIVSNPSNGLLSGNAPDITYTPDENYNGSDSFTFKVNDGIVDSDLATISITVDPINDSPVAYDQAISTTMDTSVEIILSASDVDGDELSYTVGVPSNGGLSGQAPNLTYTPNDSFSGEDSFTFKVNDGTVDSNTTMVSITVSESQTLETSVSIVMTKEIKTAGRNTFVWAEAEVTIDVEGAQVTGHWENATSDIDSGLTDTGGVVILKSDQVKYKGKLITFIFVVDSVTKDGNTYTVTGETSDFISY